MNLKDTFQKLKLSISGTKTTSIDSKLDKAISDISGFKSQSGRNGYIDLVKSLISKSTPGFNIDSKQGGLFSQSGGPAVFGQAKRMNRYKGYEGTISTIDYCYRALEVLTDNIIAPDDISKISLEFKSKEFDSSGSSTDNEINKVKRLCKKVGLEEQLPQIVKNTLLYGDYFAELADAKTAATSQSFLSEQFINTQQDNIVVEAIGDYKLKIDFSSFINEDESIDSDEDDSGVDINNIHLLFHEPSRVVKLQSELYPMCFGYLIFPKTTINPGAALQDQPINDICQSLIKNIQSKIPQMSEFNSKELKDIVGAMVASGEDYNKIVSVRYVPTAKIKHFHRPSSKYYPYGESIFDSCQFTAKCLVAMETALAVQRLARSTEKRKIAVEIGLPRDARQMVEKLKEELNKRKVTLDDYGTVDTIPSMVSTFEDIYIPQKDGKSFVDISGFTEGNVDVRSKIEELKFLRDSVVASLGVPASFLNIEENLSNKSALTEENILFARTIISHQKYLTHQLNDLIKCIYNILDPEEGLDILDKVEISLPPPKSLQFERESRYLGELATLIETLERIGIPKEYSKKKYLLNIDWDELKKYEIDETIDKKLGTDKDPDDPMGGGMGGMGY